MRERCLIGIPSLFVVKELRMPRESVFQKLVLDRIKRMFPDCIILKNDPNYLQGIPDFVIFHGRHYAMLEFKSEHNASVQPNQRYYIAMFNDWAYASFVDPDNVEQVLDDLQFALGT
jgi:VRR-NUC domain